MREVHEKTIIVDSTREASLVSDDSSSSLETSAPTPRSSLLDMKPGEKGVIERIERSMPEIRQRLLEMGLVSGTPIECVRFAPLGDPLQVRIDRTNVSMRKTEARLVLVRRTV